MARMTADDAFRLANLFRQTAVKLGDWRIANRASLTRRQWDELDDQEITLLNAASDMYTRAIGVVLADTEIALSRLTTSVGRAKTAVRRITRARQAIELVTALLLLVVAVTSGNAEAILSGIKGVNAAAAAIPNPDDTED